MSIPAVMHVEVGGSYGGSLRALELYLKHCDPTLLGHHLLVYYPTPEMERLRPLVRSLQVLSAPPAPEPSRRGRIPRPRWLRPLEEWLVMAACLPRARHLAGVLRASGCSLVHCNNSFPYQAPTLLAARWAGLPVAAHVRNPLTGSRVQRWLARQVAVVLPLHAGQEAQLRTWNLAGDVVRCPDGIELPPMQAVRVAALRHRLLPQGGVLLGSLGRLAQQKGYAELIAAAARVLPRHADVRLVIFGEGAERQALTDAIALHGLEERVLLAGYAADTANLLAALDLFVCSSRWEGLPLAVLEAMLAGVPVVATRSALAGEPRLFPLLAAPPAEAGVEALAQTLEHALARRTAAAERSAAARHWVEAEFAPAAAAGQIDATLARHATPAGTAGGCRGLPTPARPAGRRLPLVSPPREIAANLAANRRAQSFYEAAYRQPEWQRPAGEASGPGARFTKMWYRAVLQNVLPRLPLRGQRVLEIGCGYGWLAPHLSAGGAAYVGLDLAESALRQFPRELPACLPVRADACRLPFANGSFDLIFCLEVLEHIPERRALLREICRVAAPRAVVVLTSPSYCNLFLPLKLLADCGWGWCRRYLTRQPVDHTQFAFRLRTLLAEYADVIEQRAIRLHPPLFERLEYRFGPGRGPARINDWLFRFEQRWAGSFPWRHLGLHTCFLLRPHGAGPR
ncbi:MAG: glycosyltransferase [Terriglobales bacterium]